MIYQTRILIMNIRSEEDANNMVIFSVIRDKLWLPLDGDYNCVVIGGGHTPRTAALIAIRTNYDCYAIDPKLRMKSSWKKIKRLSMYALNIQQMCMTLEKHTIIILPHSHVNLKTCLEQISAPSYTLITMDCCVDNSIGRKPDIQYSDSGVCSTKKEIKIWLM